MYHLSHCVQTALRSNHHWVWCTSLIPAFGRQKQVDWTSEFVASLVYRVSFRIARATQRNLVSKKQNKQTKRKKKLPLLRVVVYTLIIVG